jgi:hypothetical protein
MDARLAATARGTVALVRLAFWLGVWSGFDEIGAHRCAGIADRRALAADADLARVTGTVEVG